MASHYEKYLQGLAQSFNQVFFEMTKKRTDSHVVLASRERTIHDFAVGLTVSYEDRKSRQKGQYLLGLTDPRKAIRLASAILSSREQAGVSELSELAMRTLEQFLKKVVAHRPQNIKKVGRSLEVGNPRALEEVKNSTAVTISRETHMISSSINGEAIALFVTFEELEKNVLLGKKVLVADDSRMMRTLLSRAFEKRGCVVVEAVDGQDAVEKFHAEAPALTVMDIVMPNLDGLGAIDKIRESAPQAKVLVLTATASKSEVVAAAELGVSGYLKKPIAPAALIESAAGCFK